MTDNFARLLALTGGNGGSGGTTDYETLNNKPSIGGTTLIGDLTLAELGIIVDDQLNLQSTNPVQNAVLTALLNAFPYSNVTGKPQINGVTLTGNITLDELGLNAIWVGTQAEYAVVESTLAEGTLVIITDDQDVDNVPTQSSTNLVYSGGVYAFVTQELSDKVDKVSGKELSTNDYTNADKAAVATIDDKYPKAWDVELTQAEYDALPASKYVDGKNYYITDGDPDKPIIYGFHIDPDESDPSDAVTYLMDAVGMEPAKMGTTAFNYGSWKNAFFMPKPCMLKYDGTVDYYLDPNDYSKKADGTASDVADPTYEGNAMMEWPLIWYKFEQGNATGEGYFYCSNRQVDETYICDCNRDANGDIIPHFYTAIYNGTGTDKLRSLSGVQLTSANGSGNTTGQDELDRALANNTTSFVEWYTDVLCDRQLINALHILVSKSIDSQGSFGQGISTGSKATKEAYVTGSLNNKGMFYGDITGTTTAVKTFGMENWWSCVWRRLAGLIGSADGYLYKTIQPYNTTGSGYSLAAGKPTSHGYVKHMIFGEFGFLPTDVSATSAQFFRDYYYKGKGYALVGGNSSDGAGDGFSCFDLSTPFLLPYWNISAAPSCKPRRKGEWLRMSVANEQTEGKHLCCPYKK